MLMKSWHPRTVIDHQSQMALHSKNHACESHFVFFISRKYTGTRIIRGFLTVITHVYAFNATKILHTVGDTCGTTNVSSFMVSLIISDNFHRSCLKQFGYLFKFKCLLPGNCPSFTGINDRRCLLGEDFHKFMWLPFNDWHPQNICQFISVTFRKNYMKISCRKNRIHSRFQEILWRLSIFIMQMCSPSKYVEFIILDWKMYSGTKFVGYCKNVNNITSSR